jgi:type II secretory pathway pseudopilin PulG
LPIVGCGDYGASIPRTLYLSVSGITGGPFCEDFNGDWTLTYLSSCTWVSPPSAGGGDNAFVFQNSAGNPAAQLSIVLPGGSTAGFYFLSPWDGTFPLVVNYQSSSNCGSWPSTITITTSP